MSSSPFLAGPISNCCITGFKHEGEPVGRVETIAGIETYVSDPPSNGAAGPKKVIMFFSDVFGPFYTNAQLLQDYFASCGYHVVGLDYMFGDYFTKYEGRPVSEIIPWVDEKLRVAREETPKWIDEIRKIYGEDAKYCSIGYCFGGPFTIELAATDKVVAAGFVCPIYITEEHFRNIKKPFLLSCSEHDVTFPTPQRHKAEEILAEIKATYHVQVFSGVEHGFAARGDITIENIRWTKEQSAKTIITWFDRFCSA
ncbi:alpha/beta-hydrolase [Pholiota conissans]|uniref:Alpha/beta-hydrolase n=1 Tax=Pholiota conissans TaxID=109636 RepID=A0A9P6D2N7_9AGAR|nr:alpha/beta-hydrolase [Pholiota conissans]